MLTLPTFLTSMVGADLPPTGQGYGGTFRTGLKSEPQTFIPDFKSDYGANSIGGDIWPQLVGVDWGVIYGIPPPQGVQYDLATDYEVSSDGLTHTFHLREDAMWTDGEPITAKDVEWSLNWILTDERVRFHFKLKDNYGVTSVEATDDYTIEIKVSKFNADWLLVFAQDNGHGFKVYPKHMWEGIDPFENPERLMPTVTGGPYTIETWEKGQYILLKRNPDYYLDPFPFVDFVMLKIMSDPDTIWAALLADELDAISYEFAPAYPVQKLVIAGAYPGIELHHTGSIYSYPLKINHENPILAIKEVRQAIAYAVNREEIVEKGFQDVWPANYYYAHEGSVWLNPDARAPDHDKEKAEELLDQAGFPRGADGTRFEIRLTAMPVTAPMTSAEIIKQQLEDVGISVKYEIYDHSTVSGMILEGDFDLITEWSRYGPSPNDGYFALWHSDGRYNKGRFRWENAEYDAIIDEALTAVDFEDRKALFYAAQVILAEEVVEIPIVFEQKNQITSTEWRGTNAQPTGWGVNGNWWGRRAVWDTSNVVEQSTELVELQAEVNDLKDELASLSGQLAFTSEALAAGLNQVSDSLGTMADSIADISGGSSEVTQIEDSLDKLGTNVNTLQTIVLASLVVSLIAAALPFVRKN